MTEKDKTPRLAQGREHVVATVDEIPSGTHKLVPIGRHGVGVYNVNGTFYAIANYCP
ncbi:(2Fe-2S)-binding protein, partial [Mycobacterium sp. ITM-2017-0098]